MGPLLRLVLVVGLSSSEAFHVAAPAAAMQKVASVRSVPIPAMNDRKRTPDDPDFDPTVDIPDGATPESLRPKGPGGILAGLPWWFPLALGWLLAPGLPQSPLADIDIFKAPTAQQERQILREERAIISEQVKDDLYGR